MATDSAATGIERLCRNYGPSRLPGADHTGIGAGYAMATAALVSTVVWVLLVGGVELYGSVWDPAGNGVTLLVGGALIASFFMPGAFISGVLVWSLLPERLCRRGALTGILSMTGAYVAGALLASVIVVQFEIFFERFTVIAVPLLVLYMAGFAFILSGWLSLPVGAAIGHVHQRARGESVTQGRAWRAYSSVRTIAARALGPTRDRLVARWARYGPGRLPKGDSPAIGAGYAFAAVAGVLAVVAVTSLLTIVANGTLAFETVVPRGIAVALGTVVPVAFAAGTLAWARLPAGLPYRGVIAGTGTMAVTSLVSGCGAVLLLTLPAEPALVEALKFGVYVLLYLGWLTLPVGALIGHVHQRAR